MDRMQDHLKDVQVHAATNPHFTLGIRFMVLLLASETEHDAAPGQRRLSYASEIRSSGRKEGAMEWIIVIVLVLVLLAAIGPRAGYYGTASPLYDVLSLLIFVGLLLFVLDLLGVIEVFGVGA
jgi:hypothetical protein